jgi:hypothetical protein
MSASNNNKTIQEHLKPHIIEDPDMVSILKEHTLMLYDLPKDMNYFPGQLPCSLMRENLRLLEELDYMVAEKSDGVRCLLLIMSDGVNNYCLLIDRGFRFYRTNLTFDASLFRGFGTLFDGEIVVEPTGFKMYVHDVICLAGDKGVAKLNYSDRVRLVREAIMFYSFPGAPQYSNREVHQESTNRKTIKNFDGDIVQVLPKRVYPFSELKKLWNQEIPSLSHKNDGLVFTPNALPHKGKKCKELFKYKKPHEHTIDLQLGERLDPGNQCATSIFDKRRENEKLWKETDPRFGKNWPSYVLYTWDTKDYLVFGTTALAPEIWKSIDVNDPSTEKGIILECAYHSDKNMWVPIAARRDKLVPNDNYTVRRTITTIMEHLTIVELINISEHYKKHKEQKKKRLV